MSMDIDKSVNALSDAQAVAACDALIIFLGSYLNDMNVSETAKPADLADYEKLFEAAGSAEKELRSSLDSDEVSDVEVAGAARAMLLLVSDLGFTEQVEAALAEGEIHVRDLGVVSVPLVLGSLAVLLSWVPIEQRKNVYSKRRQNPDGTWIEEEVTEIYNRRVGAEAVKAFSRWVMAFIPGSA